jgi:shikimate dehydrogenase
MAVSSAGRLKLVPLAETPGDLGVVRQLLAESDPRQGRLAAFASGRAGMLSRLLALSWGSWATYGAARPGAETADGQFTVRDLLEIYTVDTITSTTRCHALIGSSVRGSPSPALHPWPYRPAGPDARYFPVELDRWDEVAPLFGEGGLVALNGLAVTRPFKIQAARACGQLEPFAARAGAVNTIRFEGSTWHGCNTDGPACLALVQAAGVAPGASVALLGAGGTARAVAAALSEAGHRVVLFNRTRRHAEAVAHELGVGSAPREDLATQEWDVLVQTTPLGTHGELAIDPTLLRGRLVVDAAYTSSAGETPLIDEARRRGLATRDGIDWLAAQGALQCERMVGWHPAPEELAAIARAWLASADGAPRSSGLDA